MVLGDVDLVGASVGGKVVIEPVGVVTEASLVTEDDGTAGYGLGIFGDMPKTNQISLFDLVDLM